MQDTVRPDFQTLFEAAPGLYLVLTPDLRIVAASNAYLRATMTTREGILGRYIFDVFPDNPRDPSATGVRNLRASLERVLATGQAHTMAVQKYDVRRPEAEGGEFEERYWSPVNSPVLDQRGRVAYIIHRVEDITEFIHLKQTEQRAAALEDRALKMEAEIYQHAQEMVETNRQLSAANDGLARLYRQISLLMERDRAELNGVKAAQPAEGIAEVPYEPIQPEIMLARIEELILEHKRLEAQLRQAQKMEAVGRLAGGVAHDFNNLLTVITGYVELLRETISGAGSAELDQIEKAALRAAALTQKLLAFSRQQIVEPRVVDLSSVITGMEEMLRRLIGEDVLLVTILGSHLGKIKADPNQLEQMIMNLAVNARDAMPSGGRLMIETSNVHLDTPLDPVPAGDYVLLRVTDTGHGMDAKTAARAFEPFFTTKPPGKGTGLGLASVYGTVQQSGGNITVESSPGAGATFRIYFPVNYGAESVPLEPAAVPGRVRAGTILLVEDDKTVRDLAATILASAGYRVIAAANGEEALARAGEHQPIDLVLTDVVMPGMNGPDLVRRLRARRPDTAVLFMSGYDRDLINPAILGQNIAFLPKPFTRRTLLAKIQELFARRFGAGSSNSAA